MVADDIMKMGKLYDGLKYAAMGIIGLLIAFFLYASLREVTSERPMEESLEALPDYNYVLDIKALKDKDVGFSTKAAIVVH